LTEVSLLEGAGAQSFVVDAEGKVVASTTPRVGVGASLDASSWLGATCLDAIDGARTAGGVQRRAGRDYSSDTHWLVSASVLEGAPWRARVIAIDVTLAVESDRAAVLGKVVHTCRNIGAALLSVLEALDLDRPTGDAFEQYLAHLRDPAERLSVTMKHLASALVPPRPSLERIAVGVLVERVLACVSPSHRPKETLPVFERLVAGDAETLAEGLAAMIGGERGGAAAFGVDEVDVGGRPWVRFFVERTVTPMEEGDISSLWDLSSTHDASLPLRLSYARAVVRAHGGRVTAERLRAGRVGLGALLPQVTSG
jgi:hypothetical protein